MNREKIFILLFVALFVLIAIAPVFMLNMNSDKLDDKWSVVNHGDCFTFRHGTWVNRACYKSKSEALTKMKEFKAFGEKLDEHNNKAWKDI